MANSASFDAPREPRSSVIIRAGVEGIVGQGSPGERRLSGDTRVRNLSRTGACIDDLGFLVGDTVSVSMGSIVAVAAEVMWVRPPLAGLHFHAAVDLEAARRSRSTVAPARPGVSQASVFQAGVSQAGATQPSAPPPSAGWAADLRHAYRRDT